MKTDAELMNEFFETNHYEPTVDWRDPKFAALAKYSPDQPREPDGKFGEGDGGSEKTVVYRLGWAGEKQDAEKGTGSFAGDAARVASHINYTEEADKAAGDTIFAYEVPKVTEWIKQRQGNTIMLTDKAKLIGSVPLSDVYEKAKAGMFDVTGTHIESLFSDHAVKKYSPDQPREPDGKFGEGDGSNEKDLYSRVKDKSGAIGAIKATVYRSGPAVDAGRGLFFAGEHAGAAAYADRYDNTTKAYEVEATNAFVAPNQKELYATLNDGASFWDAVMDRDKETGGGFKTSAVQTIESDMARQLKEQGYDALIYNDVPPPAKSEFAILNSATASFKEKKLEKYSPDQPRDDHGRFGSGGASSDETVTVFHGTAAAYVDDVIKNGLLPVKSSRVALGENRRDKSLYRGIRGESVYVTPHADDALKYATATASAHRESLPPDQRLVDPTQQYLFGDKRYPMASKTPLVETAILHFEVPKSVADKFKIDEHDNINSTIRDAKGRLVPRGGFRIESGSLSAKYLKGYDLITKDQYGEDIHSKKYISLSKVDGGETTTVYAVVFFAQKSADDVKKYSPDQPRDDHGRFGSGGSVMADGTEIDPNARNPFVDEEKARGVEIVAKDMAEKLGYTGEIEVTRGQDYKFQLNGKTYLAAGTADLKTGKITLYPSQLDSGRQVEGVLAHEIGHETFEPVMQAKSAELKMIANEPDVEHPERHVMQSPLKPDGELRPGFGLEKKYPVYALTAKFDMLNDRLQKEDGVSQYSRDWYKAYMDGTATNAQAQHETFAEINRIVYEGLRDTGTRWGSEEAKQIKPVWRQYYVAVTRASKALDKKKKS